ncbi:MAG: polysaccharide biosynthesis protein [Proteobacteria bacterium]|nr:polysaccharide biosynthesis protein [Pseudomonadota bacterium]
MSFSSNLPSFDVTRLLDRPLKAIDEEAVRDYFFGKTVLVSGAGGSIGSEICMQVARFGARKLIMVEACEFNLYQIDLKIRESGIAADSGIEIQSILVSATDRTAIRRIFKRHRPDTVLHAAAFKHVPLVECNPIAGIKNNLTSTMILAEAALDFRTSAFLLISSDKAVNPTNIMGLTKRCCELLIQSMERAHPGRVRFMAVRFGNVLASSGSVIPRFLTQIQNGGPVTVTHRDVTRFFMIISEAVGLVLQSVAMASGGEIFVLNMGEPVLIKELAEQVIRCAGREPHKEIKIEFTGLRPGEKLYEELILEGDEKATTHGDIFVAIPKPIDHAEVLASIRHLLDLAESEDAGPCLSALREIVFGGREQTLHSIMLNAQRMRASDLVSENGGSGKLAS